jgi:hypothetical protein
VEFSVPEARRLALAAQGFNALRRHDRIGAGQQASIEIKGIYVETRRPELSIRILKSDIGVVVRSVADDPFCSHYVSTLSALKWEAEIPDPSSPQALL